MTAGSVDWVKFSLGLPTVDAGFADIEVRRCFTDGQKSLGHIDSIPQNDAECKRKILIQKTVLTTRVNRTGGFFAIAKRVEMCPRKVLERDETVFVRGFHPVVVARPEDFTVCRLCELLCPDLAIAVSEED